MHSALLRRAVSAALAAGGAGRVGEVCVRLVDDAQMRRLNRTWRGKDAATDVLSFPFGDGERPDEPFGDVVISVASARRQARAYGAPLREELARLSVHGALHLCGYDHHARDEARVMHGLTRRLVRSVIARRG